MDDAVAGVQEKRCGLDRRCGDERRTLALHATSEAMSTEKSAPNIGLEVIGSLSMAALGIGVYEVTGLHGAVESEVLEVVLGAVIVFGFISSFRAALHF
jgi:hypothetical protein